MVSGGFLIYNADLFDRTTALRRARNFERLVEARTNEPTLTLDEATDLRDAAAAGALSVE